MATTTPNFGWPVPTSTDLVKDGATAIEALGDSIDASLLDLKGGTTGQVLSKTSGTDMDFTWVTSDDANAIQNTIVDAKGDLITATAADTPARLAVGTNGQVLTADSTAATGIKWAAPAAGGMTLLSTTTLSGTSTSISSIDQTYTDLKVIIYGTSNTSSSYYPLLIPNGTNNVGNYIMSINNNGSAVTQAQSGSNFAMNYGRRSQTDTTNTFSIVINNYASTAMRKTFFGSGTQVNNSGNREAFNFGGMWDFNTAISSLNLTILDTGSWAGGTVLVYGVK